MVKVDVDSELSSKTFNHVEQSSEPGQAAKITKIHQQALLAARPGDHDVASQAVDNS